MSELIPKVSINFSRLAFYESREKIQSKHSNYSNLKRKGLEGKVEISKSQQKIMKEKIAAMCNMAKVQWVWSKTLKKWFQFKLSFITLTLSSRQAHSDNFLKKNLLNNFLTQLRQRWKVTQYIWRAETQNNGNIHFHIICNRYIDWRELRSCWNSIQNNYGYIDDFFHKHNNKDPNSTDIHSVKRIRNLEAYITKYLTKKNTTNNEQKVDVYQLFDSCVWNIETRKRVVSGRVWGCSYFLSNIKNLILDCIGNIATECDELCKRNKLFFPVPYCSFLYMKPNEWKIFAPTLWERFRTYIWNCYDSVFFENNF